MRLVKYIVSHDKTLITAYVLLKELVSELLDGHFRTVFKALYSVNLWSENCFKCSDTVVLVICFSDL